MFWILAANKTAKIAARGLGQFLSRYPDKLPFEAVLASDDLAQELKSCGIGSYNNKARTLREVSSANLDLRTCSAEDLISIWGIGLKTAKCFLLHTRRDVQFAGLDTHILKFLASLGHQVPKSTPNAKQYSALEAAFLAEAKRRKQTPAELDLEVWRSYSNKPTVST